MFINQSKYIDCKWPTSLRFSLICSVFTDRLTPGMFCIYMLLFISVLISLFSICCGSLPTPSPALFPGLDDVQRDESHMMHLDCTALGPSGSPMPQSPSSSAASDSRVRKQNSLFLCVSVVLTINQGTDLTECLMSEVCWKLFGLIAGFCICSAAFVSFPDTFFIILVCLRISCILCLCYFHRVQTAPAPLPPHQLWAVSRTLPPQLPPLSQKLTMGWDIEEAFPVPVLRAPLISLSGKLIRNTLSG